METTDIIGIIFVVLGIIFYLALGTRLYRSYKVSEKKQTLYLSLLLLFGGLALLLLTLEQLVLLTNAEEASSQTIADAISIFQYSNIDVFWVGFLFASLAWITSGLAIISANFFTQSFFPDSNKKLLLIPILLITAYLVLIITSPFYFEYNGSDWSPNHDAATTFILWILFLVPLWTVSFLFLYLSVSLKRKGASAWRRVGWFFLSQVILSIGFTIEVLSPSSFTTFFDSVGISLELLLNDSLWSISARFMIMIYAVLMWIAVYTPNWAKGWLGASKS
ncbi:MAG: hypothetical protein ACW98F_15450 [Candidatus Hodarchaeales archaeon]|jgi:hypothetical protein